SPLSSSCWRGAGQSPPAARAAWYNGRVAKQPAVPDITICILNWNAKGYLARCLDSLFHPEEPDVQEALERAGLAGEQEPAEAVSIDVLVVDNGPIDYSAAMAESPSPEVPRRRPPLPCR